MSVSRFFSLLRRKPAPPSTGIASRIEVRPPALWGQAEPVWLALWHWLGQSDAADRRRLGALDAARQDFCAALAGLNHPAAQDLQRRAGHARSLREVWHLRAELYSVIACHLNQAEAIRRLDLVNRHFPVAASPGRPSAFRSDREPERHD